MTSNKSDNTYDWWGLNSDGTVLTYGGGGGGGFINVSNYNVEGKRRMASIFDSWNEREIDMMQVENGFILEIAGNKKYVFNTLKGALKAIEEYYKERTEKMKEKK